jgi:site-specific DNA-cytosine methylase
MGYSVGWGVWGASDVGALHQRERVFIVAHAPRIQSGRPGNGPSGNELGRAVNRSWPTPTTRDYKDGSAAACANVPANGLLGRVVHQWPTPTANRWDGLQSHGVNVVSGSLNPTWVEGLMGFPIGWTDLTDGV